MRGFHRLIALCALLLTVPLAAQQQSQPEPGQSVTVIGERERNEAEARRESSRFFESHAVRTRIGQLARWHEPICVRTGGLPPELSVRIATRIMEIAERIEIPTNRAELCRPNVRIGFTSEPQRMIERAYRRNRAVIGFHYVARREETMRVRQPVQAWYTTRTRSGAGATVIDQAGVRTPAGGAGSRLTSYISSELAHVLVLADMRYVDDADVDPMAELLAFLALAQTPVAEACDAAETILNLVNPGCPPGRRPRALTRQDEAYLRALYSVNPESRPRLQRGNIVSQMTDTLTGER